MLADFLLQPAMPDIELGMDSTFRRVTQAATLSFQSIFRQAGS
jgi:hypothetical protein